MKCWVEVDLEGSLCLITRDPQRHLNTINMALVSSVSWKAEAKDIDEGVCQTSIFTAPRMRNP